MYNNDIITMLQEMKSVYSIENRYICVMCYWRTTKIQQQQIPLISIRSPFNILHSMPGSDTEGGNPGIPPSPPPPPP